MLRKNSLYIRIQQGKSYQNDELFFVRFEKVFKMQAGVNIDKLKMKPIIPDETDEECL